MSCWCATTIQNDPPQDADSSVEFNVLQMDDLARIILEMLHVLKEKGPQTKDVFHKIDNIKSFLSLKERVMLGGVFDWANESPLVVAALLKDCLRLIPSTIFMKQLYCKWISVLDKQDEEKATEIKR
ncbi:rho GTPase-activating protein 20-like [Ochotona princeps]|uniref:rho GTPase-activating protein 20-like n=1 Tax=Ochotona princeps TaxID=9978 RepID=UPI0027152A05|nr:rho GTPase-activating protein 20-like [Ochotona princeps]